MTTSYIDGWWNKCISHRLTVLSFMYLCKALDILDVNIDAYCLLSSIVFYCFTDHYLDVTELVLY